MKDKTLQDHTHTTGGKQPGIPKPGTKFYQYKQTLDDMTPLEYKFCEEFIKDLNGQAAYVRAGGSPSLDNAVNQARNMLSRPAVRAKIQEFARAAIAERQVAQSTVLQSLAALATTSILDIASWDEFGNVKIKPSNEIPPHHAFAIQSIKQVVTLIPQKSGEPIEKRTLEVKLYDKTKPLNTLAKHLGLLEPSKGGDQADLGERLEKAKARLAQKRELRLVAGDDGVYREDESAPENAKEGSEVGE